MITYAGSRWRGHRDRKVVDGMWYRMRKIHEKRYIDELPSPLGMEVVKTLMSPALRRGGLVMVCGGPGSGKSTTASALAISRLRQYGGMCSGFEDPPEYDLNGWHGEGYFNQTWVDDWVEALHGGLRSQPTGTDLLMYVGEVRSATTAEMMIRAAGNGFLVITTCFGDNLVSGIETFKQMLEPKVFTSFASVLRAVVHQTLENKKIKAEMLVSPSATSNIAITMRRGQLEHLTNDIEYQRTAREHGKTVGFE